MNESIFIPKTTYGRRLEKLRRMFVTEMRPVVLDNVFRTLVPADSRRVWFQVLPSSAIVVQLEIRPIGSELTAGGFFNADGFGQNSFSNETSFGLCANGLEAKVFLGPTTVFVLESIYIGR